MVYSVCRMLLTEESEDVDNIYTILLAAICNCYGVIGLPNRNV